MADKLRAEIQQTKPFQSLEQEAILNLIRTASLMEQIGAAVVKPHGLSLPQYNVLRILRGAGERGLKCSAVAERMITRDPDVTRLFDRLERERLITRQRSSDDRRVVNVRISDTGMRLLATLDEPMLAAHRNAMNHMGREKLAQLIELLEDARGSAVLGFETALESVKKPGK